MVCCWGQHVVGTDAIACEVVFVECNEQLDQAVGTVALEFQVVVRREDTPHPPCPLVHGGCPGAGPDPPPLSGAEMFDRSRPLYKPIWRNWLAPENFGALLNGAGRTGILKMLSFFSAFSLGPKEGRICAAPSDFVATSIFPHHGDKWGQMSFGAH